MADAIVSAAAERLIGLLVKQTQHHINLVRGAEEKVRSLAVDLQTIRYVLNDAENRRFKEESINFWLSRLEQIASDMEDILDEWEYALLKFQMDEADDAPPKQKVCSFIPSSSCLCFNKVAVRHTIGNKILSVKAKLDEILKQKDQYGFRIDQHAPSSHHLPPLASWRPDQTTSMVNLADVHGRDRDRDYLVNKIMDNSGSQEESGFHVLSIVGVGGLGKTTLAQMVYNDNRVAETFDLKIWVCVSDPFDLAAVAKRILESIKEGSSPNTDSLDVLFKKVKESTSGRKFLLVLDDVWEEDRTKWESLKNSLGCGGGGSKILVTSRSEVVVKLMGSRESDICRPGLLSDNDSWLLLRRVALQEKDSFEDIGKKIAEKCKGLPLAVKTLGSLLCVKSTLEQWSSVLNSEIWQMKEAEVNLFPHLLLSYNELSPTLKRCFSYCAFFPKDTMIYVEELIQNWMALGYLGSNIDDMELNGRMYFDTLARRSLFQDFEIGDTGEIEYCKMHDIVHDFAQFLKNKGKVEATRTKSCTGSPVCKPTHVSMVSEFCTLYHGEEAFPNICDCIVRVRVLEFQDLTECIPRRMKDLIHLRRLILDGISKLSREDLKVIFQLYYLQSLCLSDCGIEEIPKEIGNLIHLRFLSFHSNKLLKELPIEIGNLIHLRHLNLMWNKCLKELPESLCNLQKLQTLDNYGCVGLCKIPERLVNKLSEIPMGIDGIKLESILKNKKDCLRVYIRLDGDLNNEVVEDARKAELRNETHITNFEIRFPFQYEEGSSSWMDLMEALQPHPNLCKLSISRYMGSKFPLWMVSPLNQLRDLFLQCCYQMTSLPPFGKLPCLEYITLDRMGAVEIVGREFLGITRGQGDIIAFPKLKSLTVWSNFKWEEWEDITEEEAKDFVIMPSLTQLDIIHCRGLRMLPHRLLSKVSSLKMLDISYSTLLQQRYEDKDGSDWKAISINNPALSLISYYDYD